MKRALVVRGGALGDLVLTLPIRQALAAAFETVNLLTNRRFGELVGERIFALDAADLAPGFVANSELPERWRHYFSEHELVVSYLHDPAGIFAQHLRKCGVSCLLAGPYRMEAGEHATEQLARPLLRLGISVNDWEPHIAIGPCEGKRVSDTFDCPCTALHVGSGSVRKNWPIQNWIQLIDELLTRGERVVVIGGEADQAEVAGVRQCFGEHVKFALNLPLRRLAALLAGSKFVGHDSGISHLAAATGAECLVLFGPTDAQVWAPRNRNVRVLVAPESDLTRLAVEQVRSALGFTSPASEKVRS